jgi:DNA-binding NarL/FixJ family response regulator
MPAGCRQLRAVSRRIPRLYMVGVSRGDARFADRGPVVAFHRGLAAPSANMGFATHFAVGSAASRWVYTRTGEVMTSVAVPPTLEPTEAVPTLEPTEAVPPTLGPTEARDDAFVRTRLLVVDDHAAVRAGLRELLADEPDFEVVAAVASAEAGVEVAERWPIDVAVVDYQLGGRNGLWLSRKLKRRPEPPAVLIYSAYTNGVLSAAAVVAEADAIVSKGQIGADLCRAVRAAAAGQRDLPRLPPRLAESLRLQLNHEEQALFGMLLAGIDTADVAATLGLSAGGLESRLWELLRRLEGLPAAGAS